MKIEDNTSLEYKDHRDFFEDYFKFRREFILGLSALSFSNDKKGFTELYKSLNALIDWTNNYIFNENIDKLLKELNKDIIIFNSANTILAKELIVKFRKIIKLINVDHEKAEILPKKMIGEISEEDKYYYEEQVHPLKYAKKAFTDLLLKRF